MQRTPLLRCAAAWGLLVISANLLPAAEFVPLGFAVDGGYWSAEGVSVSEDGSVVVGTPLGAGTLHRWTPEAGAEVLLEKGRANVSGDGSTIVGYRMSEAGNWVPVRITDGGEELLPLPGGYESGYARAVSQDGNTVAGYSANRETLERALLRWTDAGVHVLEEWFHEPHGPRYEPRAMSAAGDVIVGGSTTPFRWAKGGGMKDLPLLTSESYLQAFGVSSDGRWTVGTDGRPNDPGMVAGWIPVRWDGLSPPEPLSFDSNWRGCSAFDVNADGSHIVGMCYRTLGDNVEERAAAMWTQETGFVSLQDLLVSDYGLGEALDGWRLQNIQDITDDGRFLVGRATNPDGSNEAFLVDLSSPNLPGDFNADGQLDARDIDQLSAVVREGFHLQQFDLTDDDLVTEDDRVVWVHQLKNTYFGDANLDGEFNTGDLTHALEAGKYETGATAGWDEGDWNGDAIFGTGDFVTALIDGGYEQGPKQDVSPVPEPANLALLLSGLWLFPRWWSRSLRGKRKK